MKRKCRDCKKSKNLTEFYCTKGQYRGECKKCTIIRNSIYQKKYLAQKTSCEDVEKRRQYHKEYYQKNKEKFENYRLKYKKQDPDYFKNYQREYRERLRGLEYEK